MATFFWSPLGVIVVTAVTLAIAFFWFKRHRSRTINFVQQRPHLSFWLKVVEKAGALGGASLIGWYDVLKQQGSSWVHYGVGNSYVLLWAFWLVAFSFLADWLRDRISDSTGTELCKLRASAETLEGAMKRWLHLISQFRKLIEVKMDRLREKGGKGGYDRDCCEHQIRTIVQLMHQFFESDLVQQHPGARLRLGIYAPNSGKTHMEILHAWDGQKANCFRKHPDRMIINSHKGIRSIVTKTYYLGGTSGLFIVPDCASDPAFEYFDDEQKEYLKSMIALKCTTMVNGTEDAIVFTLDCDRTGYFAQSRAEEFKSHLHEMLKRIEFEFFNLEIAKSA